MKKGKAVGTYLILVSAVLLAKILGLVRTMLLSRYYGASALADAFNAASSLPLNLYDITLGTAIASAFVPVFNDKLANGEREQADRFASNFLNCAVLISAVLAAAGMLFPEAALKVVASGLQGEALAYAAQLTRIIMPVIAIATGTYVFIGVLQSYGEFTGPALVSLCYNAVMIIYFLFFDRYFGIYGLGAAFSIGWLLQLLFLLPYLRKKKFRYSFALNLEFPDQKPFIENGRTYIARGTLTITAENGADLASICGGIGAAHQSADLLQHQLGAGRGDALLGQLCLSGLFHRFGHLFLLPHQPLFPRNEPLFCAWRN